MKRALVLLLLTPWLSAASCSTIGFLKPDPAPIEVEPSCFRPCARSVPWVDWPEQDGTADMLAAIFKKNHESSRTNDDVLAQCDQQRQACALPLRRSEQAGAVKIIEREK